MQLGFFIISALIIIPEFQVACGSNSTIASDEEPSSSNNEIIDRSLSYQVDSDIQRFNHHVLKQQSIERASSSNSRILTTAMDRMTSIATSTITPVVQYIEVKNAETCETFGYTTITNKQDCIDAAIFVGRTIIWGPSGGWNDVVTGCSARFSSEDTNLFFQQPDVCDTGSNMNGWAYTGCKCTDWMPCLCLAPNTIPSSPPSKSESPSIKKSLAPTLMPSKTSLPSKAPIATPTITPVVEYIEVHSETCETFGYTTITNKQDCIDAAIFVGRTVIWGPSGGWNDVVTGCSARFSSEDTNLFFQEPDVCDTGSNINGWAYTGCKCTDWMPCLCLAPNTIPSSPPSISESSNPSVRPGYCQPEDVMGKIFFASGANYCFKIVVRVDGQIIGDNNDPKCNNQSGAGIPFSNFNGFTGRTLNWTSQNSVSGTMDFFENVSLPKPKLVIKSFQNGKFDVTLELPSCVMTDSPSLTPTVYPSNAFCSKEDVSGYTFFANFVGYCFKIELVNYVGKIVGDKSDPNCNIKSGTGTPFSNFDGFSGNTAIWSTGIAGFSGTMNFLRDPTISGPKLINNGLNGQIFDVTLVLPSCQQIP